MGSPGTNGLDDLIENTSSASSGGCINHPVVLELFRCFDMFCIVFGGFGMTGGIFYQTHLVVCTCLHTSFLDGPGVRYLQPQHMVSSRTHTRCGFRLCSGT